jgi:hypothetical protein
VLIPCLSDPRAFENSLASVLQNRPDDCEVLVAHACEYYDPYRLAGEVCFLHVPEARTIVSLLSAGFEAARSSIVHVLQCGLEVEEGWTDAALRRFDDEQVATVIPVITEAKRPDRMASAGLAYSRRGRVSAARAGRRLSSPEEQGVDIVGPTLAAGFYRRSWWRLVRWDDSMGDDFADAQLNLSLAKLGAITVLEPSCLIRAEAPVRPAADEPCGFLAARRAERLFWRQSQQAPSAGSITWRVALSLAEALLAMPSPRAATGLMGRMAGMFSSGDRRAYQQRMAQLAERLSVEKTEAEQAATVPFEAALRRRNTQPSQKRAA